MTWRPINPAHAIERVRLIVQYKQELSEKLIGQIVSKIDAIKGDARLEGPTPLPGVKLNFTVTPNGEQQFSAPQLPSKAWSYVRYSTARQPLEIFNIQGSQLIYETGEYRRWHVFVQRLNKVVSPSLELAENSLDTDLIALEYYDRFFFDGEVRDASPTGLVAAICGALPPDAVDNAKLWHLHRGWFESCDLGDVLINQNCDALDAIPPGKETEVRTLGILTRAEFRHANYPVSKFDSGALIEKLHEVTNSTFMNVLNPEILPMIGVGPNS